MRTSGLRFPRRTRAGALAALIAFAGACERSDAHVTAPKGAEAFARYVAIGTGLSAGAQSGGVVYESQLQAWPALLARAAGAGFTTPLLRTPGCSPPLIAPLQLARLLSGASATAGDSSCAGRLDTLTPPLNSLALPGATAWSALNLTPRGVAAAPAKYDVLDRSRYPLVLGATQSQVTAMLIERPTLVSVELGLGEVLGAATSGLVVTTASYTQAAAFTFVPVAIFAPVYAAIADSVKRSGARAVLLAVPRASRLYALRAGAELWAERAALATFGVTVAADCNASPNFVFTAALVPALAARAQAMLAPQPLSCADVSGAADHVLTPADVLTLDTAVDQMNQQIRALAEQNGWAFADVDAVFAGFVSASARPPYRASDELTSVRPYGPYLSLDGIHPSVAGQLAIASAVARALDARYGFAIAERLPSGVR